MFHWHFHYFSTKINREFKELYWFAAINALALGLTFIFEPIYLYTLDYSLTQILWYYVMVYFAYSIVIFPCAKIASRIGYKHSIFLASIMFILYWITLYSIAHFSFLFFVAPLLFALQKSFFWPAYNADVALASTKEQRGREVGSLFSLTEVFFIVGPLIGGIISATLGFGALFAIAAVLIVAAVIPLFRTPDIYPEHRFSVESFEELFKARTRNFFAYWGYAEDLMVQSLWPLFIFITIPFFVGVGTVATFASLIAAMIMLYMGRRTDFGDKKLAVKISSVAYGITWIFRFLASGIAGVMIFDVLTKTGRAFVRIPELSLTYDLASRKGPSGAIVYTVFYELSLSAGKVVTALAGIAILTLTSNIFYVFALAGLLTMLYSLLNDNELETDRSPNP
jgi:MFS family permease